MKLVAEDRGIMEDCQKFENDSTNSTFSTNSTVGDKVDNRRHLATFGDNWRHLATNSTNSTLGLKDLILEFIQLNQGSFTNQDIDRELGLSNRKDKQYRSKILNNILKDNIYITADKRRSGVYHILKRNIDWIDLENTSNELFDITLPLGLSDYVNIPPKSIIIIAGTKGSGKTSLALQILKQNLPFKGKSNLMYLMSEMGGTEYKRRIEGIGADITKWNKSVKSASIATGFHGPIANFNRDGISVVDFLEEVDGEYFRIASDIRNIYDSLGDGIAIVAIQKHSKQKYGRGGEATREKARLYLTMDVLCYGNDCNITAVRIIDAKDYPNDNPHGKECHVMITRGSEIQIVKDWQWMTDEHREYYTEQYEQRYRRD